MEMRGFESSFTRVMRRFESSLTMVMIVFDSSLTMVIIVFESSLNMEIKGLRVHSPLYFSLTSLFYLPIYMYVHTREHYILAYLYL